MLQHVVWNYCMADADAPAYTYAPSHLCGSPTQDPCSPSLGSSTNSRPPKHMPVQHSDHSRSILSSSHQCQPRWGHSETAG
jgi:hypothetical protein